MRRPADLSTAEFKQQLKLHGFAYIAATGGFIDLQRRDRGARFERYTGVRDARRRINRRATLAGLIERRTAQVAAAALAEAQRAECERVAATIAPHVISAPRADLAGAAAVAQLADDYRTRFAAAGCVDFGDLLQMGWQADQLKSYAGPARAVADRKSMAALT